MAEDFSELNLSSLIDGAPAGPLEIAEGEEDADAPKTARYEDRVVAFVDVLGFKELIKRSVKEESVVATIFNALSIPKKELIELYSAEFGDGVSQADVKVHSFSDFLVVSALPIPDGIGAVCFLVFKHCRQLLTQGLASRGGIAIGKLLHQESTADVPTMVFGPAFVEAYQLESVHADAPRVIMQNRLRTEINKIVDSDSKIGKFLRDCIERAEDGPAYVNIFSDFGTNHTLVKEVEIIHGHMCRALDDCTDKPHNFKKNAHLATKFNRSIAKTPYAHLAIPREKLPSWSD